MMHKPYLMMMKSLAFFMHFFFPGSNFFCLFFVVFWLHVNYAAATHSKLMKLHKKLQSLCGGIVGGGCFCNNDEDDTRNLSLFSFFLHNIC
mmetsp:Transcript_25801/g.46839  ORF Transcript_25801/g.46839 Transcript_25801/m.46839 type:complete len:91 (-) Transcript_25801:7-279(-)